MGVKKHVLTMIEKGGEVAADKKNKKDNWIRFTLRIREDMYDDIEKELEKRIGMSATAWILEAIQEKLTNRYMG